MSAASKRCSACRRELPVSRFNGHPHTRDGLQSQCKDCNRAGVAASRAAGRTNDRAQKAAQYAAEVELRRRHRDELYRAERVARGLKPARLVDVAAAVGVPGAGPPPCAGTSTGSASSVAVAPVTGPPVLPVRAAAASPHPGDAADAVPTSTRDDAHGSVLADSRGRR